jgi:hypothetical protein
MDNFVDNVKQFMVYPRTKSLDDNDFNVPTCFYTCIESENPKCDFTHCEKLLDYTYYPDQRLKNFAKNTLDVMKNYDDILADKFDGCHLQYKPNNNDKAYNFLNFRRIDSKNNSRTIVIEINEKRLEWLANNFTLKTS